VGPSHRLSPAGGVLPCHRGLSPRPCPWQRRAGDALGYFSERLEPGPTRRVLASLLRQAKRNKAFDNCRFIGLALDGTGTSRSHKPRCELCRPRYNARHEVCGYSHHISLITVVGTGLSLPFDVEPYGPGDSEHRASRRLLGRAVQALGPRFADYVVVDGAYATAPFLHTACALGLHPVARLKSNLPELMAAATARFATQAPSCVQQINRDTVELWDADDFDPWQELRWSTVRVLRYRQHRPDGSVCEAYWLTNWSIRKVGSASLYRMAKSRWEVENQAFNDSKTRYGLEHSVHHQPRSLLVNALLIALALTLERLFRLRYLKRGWHKPPCAIALLRALRLSLGHRCRCDSS
jgi:DDE family transposase